MAAETARWCKNIWGRKLLRPDMAKRLGAKTFIHPARYGKKIRGKNIDSHDGYCRSAPNWIVWWFMLIHWIALEAVSLRNFLRWASRIVSQDQHDRKGPQSFCHYLPSRSTHSGITESYREEAGQSKELRMALCMAALRMTTEGVSHQRQLPR